MLSDGPMLFLQNFPTNPVGGWGGDCQLSKVTLLFQKRADVGFLSRNVGVTHVRMPSIR